MTSWDWDRSLDEEDVATLESFSELSERDVLKLILPECEHRGGKFYRCCRKDTFVDFCKSHKFPRWAHSAEGAGTVAFLPTVLVGVDMSVYDMDFVLRLIETDTTTAVNLPIVLHVLQVEHIAPEYVKDPVDGILRDQRQYVMVNLHELSEAKYERSIWQALDNTMTSLSHGNCPKGHRLVVTSAPLPWVCDGCERHFTRAAQPHRCLAGCDYDLCDSCFNDVRATGSDAVITELRSVIEQITSGASACKLPHQPPQDRIWSYGEEPSTTKVSERVTKWNALSLSPELAVGVRHTFMLAVGVLQHGTKVGAIQPLMLAVQSAAPWTSFQPGTGKPMRVVKRFGGDWTIVLCGRQIMTGVVLVGIVAWALRMIRGDP